MDNFFFVTSSHQNNNFGEQMNAMVHTILPYMILVILCVPIIWLVRWFRSFYRYITRPDNP